VGNRTVFEAEASAGLLGTVWLPRGTEYEVGAEMVVDATLVVIHHEEWVAPTGERFEGFAKLRLADAVVVAQGAEDDKGARRFWGWSSPYQPPGLHCRA
jgi:hypothetical protein